MVSVCVGLVTIDEDSDIIRLVHQTTQEYLQSHMFWLHPSNIMAVKDSQMTDTQKNDIALINAQDDITITCATYLLFDAFDTGFCSTDKEFEARLRLNPLYDYAARNLGYHARAASTKVEKSIVDFLKSEAKLSGSIQAIMLSYGGSQHTPKQTTGVHLAAYFGLKEVTITLLKEGLDADSKDSEGRTPLLLAAVYGNEAIVKLLLERSDINADAKDEWGGTALS